MAKHPRVDPIRNPTQFGTALLRTRPAARHKWFTANGWAGFLGTELAALNSGIEMDRVMCFLKLPSEKISNVLNMEGDP
jgi:hypothetical protein